MTRQQKQDERIALKLPIVLEYDTRQEAEAEAATWPADVWTKQVEEAIRPGPQVSEVITRIVGGIIRAPVHAGVTVFRLVLNLRPREDDNA